VRRVDAILLSGGSAFGLSAADGVVRHLREQGRGVVTPAGPVPIVPAAVIYDLGEGQPHAPGADDGYRACEAAGPVTEAARGRVGVGTGATTAKLSADAPRRGGLGVAHVTASHGPVTALVVVNAAGTIVDAETGRPLLGGTDDGRAHLATGAPDAGDRQATTLGVVLVDAPVDETALIRCAVAAHDAFARAIRPCHTIFDGDVVFAVGLRSGTPTASQILEVTTATELAMERAIVDAVTI
jgi:L-aminopeptidase/D-esterase-like protein